MEGYIIDRNGNETALPTLLAWDVAHGDGEAADSFAVECLYDKGLLEALSSACRFRAEHGGETVFTGVVDEWRALAAPAGRTLGINGRSLQALLLDNEAEAAEYYGAGLDFILGEHVYPWGITDVRRGAMSTASRLSVSSGASAWSVLEEFCVFCGDVRPRFDRAGTLLLDGSSGEERAFSALKAAEQSFTDTRYGVISEVLVKNRASRVSETVENAAFKARGGCCRRVVNVPRHTLCDAMRYTGAWQIERSGRGARVCTLTLAEPFAAFALDTVTLTDSPLGINGRFTVRRSRCRGDGAGVVTILEMEEKDDVAF